MKLAFYHGPRKGIRDKLISIVVKAVTRGPFDHVELIFSDGRTGTSSLDLGGVSIVHDKQHDPAHWVIVPVAGNEYAAWLWFVEHRGQRFDVWTVFAFLWTWLHRDCPDKWFCSEAVAAALGFSDPWRFDPNTLHSVVTTVRWRINE